MNTSYPLYSFFQSLRASGASLGIDDYELLLQALQKGWGIQSKPQLYTLCKLLWLKPQFSEIQFEEAFEEYFAHLDLYTEETSEEDDKETHTSEKEDPIEQDEDQPISDETQSQVEENPAPRRKRVKQARKHILREVEVAIGMKEDHISFDLNIGMEQEDTGFMFLPYNLPILPRQISQSWRFLRQLYPEGFSDRIDISQTVKELAKQGFLETPVFMQDHINKVKLTVMVDDEGSMVPFHDEIQILLSTIQEDLKSGFEAYYFYNLPYDNLLFNNPAHTSATRFDPWKKANLSNRRKLRILIISDAGAARGYINSERINYTRNFLHQLYMVTHNIAWLNPVPMWRWKGSSAEHIAKFVPMYDFTELGLQQIVNVLRGKQVS